VKKNLFIFFLFIFIFFSSASALEDELNGMISSVYSNRNLFKEQYNNIINTKFKIELLVSDGKISESNELFEKMKKLVNAYKNFSNQNEEFKKIESKMKRVEFILENANSSQCNLFYPSIYYVIDSNYRKAFALFENGKKARKEFNWEDNIYKERYKVIDGLLENVLNEDNNLSVYIDNSNFLKKTSEMTENVKNTIENIRNSYYNAVNPALFAKMIQRKDKLVIYYNEFLEILKKDSNIPKKDFYYTHISKESDYILSTLESIKESPQSQIVHSINALIDNNEKVLIQQNDIKMFFSTKWAEINELYQKTIAVKPYSYKDLILIEDDLKNYVQITSVYLLRIAELNEIREKVKKKYSDILNTSDKFETLSYSIVNDIAQFIIRADSAYDKGEFEIATHSYEKALNYLDRQGIIVEIHNFEEKVRNYVKVYEIDKAFAGKYKYINEEITKSVELSRKGKFEQASEIVRNVKDLLKKLISERKRHIRYVEKYENPGVEDFIIYNVKKGDTLAGISKKHYNTEAYSWKIWAWNNMNYPNPDSIYPGDILKLYKTGDFTE